MTSYVLTLIGNSKSSPLKPNHVERIDQILTSVNNTDWLAEYEACDVFFDSSLSSADITKQAHEALSGSTIDAVCTPVKGRRKKLLISDMAATVTNEEDINELGEVVGLGSQIEKITAAVINGEISFSEAMLERVALMKGMEISVLERVYKDRITLMAGARTLVQTMRHHGAYCMLASGGFTYFTQRIAERLGFHDHRGNELTFDEGKLTGDMLEPVYGGRLTKLDTLKALCTERNLEHFDVLAVGDGANDIKMIREAGLGVAYHGSECLKENTNAWIDHGDLTALLYIQGFRKSDFVIS